MDYGKLYAQRLRALCGARGLSINQLAAMSGVPQSTLDNIVRGLTHNPRARTLHRVANALGMTLAELLDFPELNDFSFEDDTP